MKYFDLGYNLGQKGKIQGPMARRSYTRVTDDKKFSRRVLLKMASKSAMQKINSLVAQRDEMYSMLINFTSGFNESDGEICDIFKIMGKKISVNLNEELDEESAKKLDQQIVDADYDISTQIALIRYTCATIGYDPCSDDLTD